MTTQLPQMSDFLEVVGQALQQQDGSVSTSLVNQNDSVAGVFTSSQRFPALWTNDQTVDVVHDKVQGVTTVSVSENFVTDEETLKSINASGFLRSEDAYAAITRAVADVTGLHLDAEKVVAAIPSP